ncbi:hypothetical protein [Sphingobacterium hungaricum]|nr:hypothetical protein [Sphingobacterium hungaricum]
MHIIKYLSFILLISFFGISCEKKESEETIEEIDLSPVELSINAGTFLDGNRIQLSGQVTKLNDLEVLDHGFLIQKYTAKNILGSETQISLGKLSSTGDISNIYLPDYQIAYADEFKYCLYVKTEKGYYKSNYLESKFDGIVIENIVNVQACIGETITVKGDFSKVDANFELKARGTSLTIPFEITNNATLLRFKVPSGPGVYQGQKIIFALKNKAASISEDDQEIASARILAVLFPPVKKLYYYNYDHLDRLALIGAGIPPAGNNNGLFILIGGQKIPYNREIIFTSISGLKGLEQKIGYHNGRDSVIFEDPITFRSPDQDLLQINPTVIHSNSSFTITGTELSLMFWNASFRLGGENVIPNGSDGFTSAFYVEDIKEGVYPLQIFSDLYNFTTIKTIKIVDFNYQDIDKKEGYLGEPITLSGSFIKGKDYYINHVSNNNLDYGYIVAKEDGELTFGISDKWKGNIDLIVGFMSPKGQYIMSNKVLHLNSLGYTYESLSPMQGHFGQVVSIKGKGIGLAETVFFDGIILTSLDKSPNEIKFVTPFTVNSGKVKIELVIQGKKIELKDHFEILN